MKIKLVIPALSIFLLALALWAAPEDAPDASSAQPTPSVPAAPSVSAPPAPSAPGPSTPESATSEPSTPGPAATEPSAPAPSAPESAVPEELPWYLTLVNADHPLPGDWSVETTQLPNGLEFDSRAYGALSDMLSVGEGEGLSFVVCSAYRTLEYQQGLFDAQVERYQSRGYSLQEATELTSHEIMLPGTSEHNLGLAADIVALSYQLLDEAQADTAEQKWLLEHCWEYGFILRYPEDKQEVTGVIYEPWHYRYVGVQAALAMQESGQCLEEYLGQN